MSGLARRIVLSPSGLSRLVDRLEDEGLLRRHAGQEDARAVFVAITPEGACRLEEAAATHVAVIRKRLLSGLDEAEMRQLAALWRRVAGEEACADPDEG
jgi:DNA-binding MarR family transcriptional regulator